MLIWQSLLLAIHLAAAATDRFDDASVALLDLLSQVEHPGLEGFKQPLENIIKATLKEQNVDVVEEATLLHKNISPTLQFLSALNNALLLILEPTSSTSSISSLPTPIVRDRVARDRGDGHNITNLRNDGVPGTTAREIQVHTASTGQGSVSTATIKSTSVFEHTTSIKGSRSVIKSLTATNIFIDEVITSATVAPTAASSQNENRVSSVHLTVLVSTTTGNEPIQDGHPSIFLSPSTTVSVSSGREMSFSPWSNAIVTSSTISTSSPIIIHTNPPIPRPVLEEQSTSEDSISEDSTSNYYPTGKYSTDDHTDKFASDDITDSIYDFIDITNDDLTNHYNDDFATDDFFTDEFTPPGDSTNDEMPSNQINDSFESNSFSDDSDSDKNTDGLATNNPVAPTDDSVNDLINELPTINPETSDSNGEFIDAYDFLIIEGPDSIDEYVDDDDETVKYIGNSTYGFIVASLLLLAVVALLYMAYHNRNNVRTSTY